MDDDPCIKPSTKTPEIIRIRKNKCFETIKIRGRQRIKNRTKNEKGNVIQRPIIIPAANTTAITKNG